MLQLPIGSVVQAFHQSDHRKQFSTTFVGVDHGISVLTTLPSERNLPEGETLASMLPEGKQLEMRTVHDGMIIAFETQVSVIYSGRLLISTYPEMLETRRLRAGTRFPCVISCDIVYRHCDSVGIISDISFGGCQITISEDHLQDFTSHPLTRNTPIQLDVYFPPHDEPQSIDATVKSIKALMDGNSKIGVAFNHTYEAVEHYLESLKLDSVASFFS